MRVARSVVTSPSAGSPSPARARSALRFARALSLAGLTALACSCGRDPGDPHSEEVEPEPGGKGDRIRDIADPTSEKKAAHQTTVSVTGAVVVAVDTFDETGAGNSSGTIYVADLGSKSAYSGISLFNPSFVPGNLRVGPGDVLDLRGQYQENQNIPIQFAPGAFLVQLATPIGTLRFEANVPEPIDVNLDDFFDYDKGRQWLNMIVRVRDVRLTQNAFFLDDETGLPSSGRSGRIGARLENANRETPAENPDRGCADPFPKAPTLVNELMDLVPLELEQGTVIKELVGVVTFFCNLHIAPRSAADIVLN